MVAGDLRLIAGCAAILLCLFFKSAALAPPPLRHDPAADGFNAERAVERLRRILGDERPHPVDTDANDAVRDRLVAEIEALGFAPEVRDDFSCNARGARIACARVRNIIFETGSGNDRAVMIASHYDSVPAGPGAADDGLGVAASLEIAALLAERPPVKPVIFLITDGEEMGLLGARSFAETDPLRERISRVISMEARGVTGPVQMFETATPNGPDVRLFAKNAARPFANSLMTDIYRLLPNDTDVSEYLPLGYGAINLAMTGGVEFYHTPRDNLAALDMRSVQHMGDLALATLDAALSSQRGEPGRVVFSDVASRVMLVFPQWLGLVALAAGLAAAAFAFIRNGHGAVTKTLIAPLLMIASGAALAFSLQYIINLLRPDQLYWRAHPEAMQALAYGSAALGGVAGIVFLLRQAAPGRAAASAWLWFAALGLCAYAVAPGAAALFAPGLAIYAAGVVLGLSIPFTEKAGAAVAAIFTSVLLLSALNVSEMGLGWELAFVPAMVGGLIFMLWAPFMRAERLTVTPFSVFAVYLVAAFISALVVPAYSPSKPRPLNIQYFVDADAGEALWLLSSTGEPAPSELDAVAAFEERELDGLGQRLAAPAPYLGFTPPTAMVTEVKSKAEGRSIVLTLASGGADYIVLRLPSDATEVLVAGRRTTFAGGGARQLICYGRSCDGRAFEIVLQAPGPTPLLLLGVHYGLPFAAAPLVSARPDWTTPIQIGDAVIVRTRAEF